MSCLPSVHRDLEHRRIHSSLDPRQGRRHNRWDCIVHEWRLWQPDSYRLRYRPRDHLLHRPMYSTFSCNDSLDCLYKVGAYKEEDFSAIVLLVYRKYLEVVRHVQRVYWLEPAGSHGVWSLDDYQMLVFFFGSAQLIGMRFSTKMKGIDHPTIMPGHILNHEVVEHESSEYLYLDAIKFILQVSRALSSEFCIVQNGTFPWAQPHALWHQWHQIMEKDQFGNDEDVERRSIEHLQESSCRYWASSLWFNTFDLERFSPRVGSPRVILTAVNMVMWSLLLLSLWMSQNECVLKQNKSVYNVILFLLLFSLFPKDRTPFPNAQEHNRKPPTRRNDYCEWCTDRWSGDCIGWYIHIVHQRFFPLVSY